jgi:transcriptional regulator with XRE-family HTH domain
MFKERLKELRKINNMTQAQLAEKLGVASGTVAMWETGKREPNFDMLEKLSDVFDRNIGYIIGRSNDASSVKLTEEDMEQMARWTIEEDFAETIMKYLRLDYRAKLAVEALINAEFNICRNEDTLLSRDLFLLDIRVKKEE